MQIESCQDWVVLSGRYRANLRIYVEVTKALSEVAPEDFNALYERAKRAHSMFESSREELRNHEAEHGCGAMMQAEHA